MHFKALHFQTPDMLLNVFIFNLLSHYHFSQSSCTHPNLRLDTNLVFENNLSKRKFGGAD